MQGSNTKLKLPAAEIRSQRAAELHERKPWEQGWRLSLPGYELLQGDIPDKLVYRLLVRHRMARTIWLNAYHPARKWMSKGIHVTFCWRLLAQYALANGWTESQTEHLLAAWRYQHGFNLHDVELAGALNTALKITSGIREKYMMEKTRKMQDKTSYRVLDFLKQGEATPAEVARGLGLPRETAKKCLQRLAKAGHVQRMDRGRYSMGTETGTNEVIDKNKNKKPKISLTQGVPVLSPPETRRDSIIVTEEERYLRQIRYIERPDGTLEIDPPDEIDFKQEQDQKLQEEFDQWEKDLAAFSRAHPEAAEPRPPRPLARQVEDWRSAPPPQFKEAHWSSPATEYQAKPY
jgi:predicted transcriptional regulator